MLLEQQCQACQSEVLFLWMSELKISVGGWGMSESDNIQVGQCPSRIMSKLKIVVSRGWGWGFTQGPSQKMSKLREFRQFRETDNL